VRKSVLKTLAVAFLVAAAVFGQAQGASAQTSTASGDRVDPDIAGIVGLGFLGTDVGILLPPLCNLHDQKWAWAVFPILGAGAGVGTGIAVADGLDKAINLSFLAVGMGAFIPVLVGSLAWKANKEERSFEQQAMLKMGPVSLNAPSLAVTPTFSTAEQFKWGAQQRSTYRLSLFTGTF
jgi:hypothetical protein